MLSTQTSLPVEVDQLEIPKMRPVVAKFVSLCALIGKYDVRMHSIEVYFFKCMYVKANIATSLRYNTSWGKGYREHESPREP